MTRRATTVAVDFPFVRCVAQNHTDDRSKTDDCRFLSWRPGVDLQEIMRYGFGGHPEPDDYFVANGMGKMLLTEIDRHQLPGRYATRVFYTRQFQDPDGRVYGKKQLRIITAGGFTTLCDGWRHEFELEPDAVPDDVVAFEKECQ